MDRRTVLAVVLSLAIWYGWIWVRGPQHPPGQTGDPAAVTDVAPSDDPNAPATDPATPTPAQPSATAPQPLPGDPGSGGAAADPNAPLTTLPFTMCGATGQLSTDGGRLHDMVLADYRAPFHTMPLYKWVVGRATGSVDGPWKPYGDEPGAAVVLSEHGAAALAGAGPLDERVPMAVVSASPTQVVLRGTTRLGVEITKVFAEARTADACAINVDVTWRNPGSARIEEPLWFAVADRTPEAGSRYQSQRQPMVLVDDAVKYGGALGHGGLTGCLRAGTTLSDTSGGIPLPGPVSWFGVADRYFGVYAVPKSTDGVLSLVRWGTADDAVDGSVVSWLGGLAPGASHVESLRMFVGPNHRDELTAFDPSLARAIDLGWAAFFGYPLVWLLGAFHDLTGDWGISIILLTFLVKLVFFPMTQRSFKSMQRMQLIQPELTRLKEEFANNPQEMNRKTFELMQQHGVNPLAGCLPMVVQMPVWISLYNVLLAAVEMYHTRFLYLKDLTEPDPFLVLPISITFLMWLQQQLSTPAAGMDPLQQQIMRYMPLAFGLMFFAFPSSLAVYVFVNMTLSILQQWLIKRSAGGGPVPTPAVAG